jgi:hypothetical protein
MIFNAITTETSATPRRKSGSHKFNDPLGSRAEGDPNPFGGAIRNVPDWQARSGAVIDAASGAPQRRIADCYLKRTGQKLPITVVSRLIIIISALRLTPVRFYDLRKVPYAVLGWG